MDAVHEEQRQRNGGDSGVLNDVSIESARGRARPFDCAACYIFGLAKNHGRVDAKNGTASLAGLTSVGVPAGGTLGYTNRA